MKKIYFRSVLMISMVMFNISLFAAGQQKIDIDKKMARTNMRNAAPVRALSMLAVGPDVVIHAAAENQQDVKIATAFNGWIYAVYTSHGGSADGIYVMRSKDHGQTWDSLISYAGNFYATDVAVCGSDTNALSLYVATVNHTTAAYAFVVNKDNATTGAPIGVPVMEIITDSIYDVALAHDFLHPSTLSTGYSVEAIYSSTGTSNDSLIAFLSIDGGATFSDRKVVDATTDFFGKVSVAYGYSPAYNIGRYFVAYEEGQLTSLYGHIKETRTDNQITDAFTTPVYLDSLTLASWFNNAVNPSISMQNSATDNDSTGLTALVLWESAYNGSNDIDAVGIYNFQAAIGGTWNYCYPEYSGTTHCKQPRATYSEATNSFLVTFWDSTDNSLPYATKSVNMPTPTIYPWTTLTANYNDQVGTLADPHPQVVLDPSFSTADFAWSEMRGGFSTGLFDAENSFTGIQSNRPNQSGFSLNQNFPNPAKDYTILSFELSRSQQVSLEVYDVVGSRIAVLINNNMDAGHHEVKMDLRQMPAGCYMYTLTAGGEKLSKNLIVIH